jgi:tetratricopeptide (TPR) repeat protein
MVKDHPLSGVGWHRFEHDYNLYQASFFKTHTGEVEKEYIADNTIIAFNEFLQTFVEFGLPGGIILLLLTFSVLLHFPRYGKAQPHTLAAAAAFLSFVVTAMASYPFHVPAVYSALICLLPVLEFRSIVSFAGSRLTALVSSLTIITLVVFAVTILSSHYAAISRWKKAEDLAARYKFREAASAYAESYHSLSENHFFLQSYGQFLFNTGAYKDAAEVFEKTSHYTTNSVLYDQLGLCYMKMNEPGKSKTALELACYITPNRFLPRYHLFKLHEQQGNLEQCRIIRSKINSMKIKVASALIDDIKEEINLAADAFPKVSQR